MDVKLVMFKANGQRREFPLTGNEATIGRSNDCELQIPLGTISRRHCQLTIEDEVVKVRDLGSSNGTFVNKTRVQEGEVRPGDTLMVGPVIFTVVINGEPETVRPVRTVIVENAVEPVSQQQREDHGTVDVEAEAEDLEEVVAEEPMEEIHEEEEEQERQPLDPLAALQALSKKKK